MPASDVVTSKSVSSSRSQSPVPKNIDYSKWNDIEISDDEDDTKKNIETSSLFRFRHQSRLERMVERKEKQEEVDKLKRELSFDKETFEDLVEKNPGKETEEMTKLREKIDKMEADLAKGKEDLKKIREPLNIDTICKDGFSSTRITKTVETPPPAKPEPLKVSTQGTFAPIPESLPPATPELEDKENDETKTTQISQESPVPSTAPPPTLEGDVGTKVEGEVTTKHLKGHRKVTTTTQTAKLDEGDLAEFVLSNRDMLTKLGRIKDWRDSRQVFLNHRELCSELGQHALTLQCIDAHLALRDAEAQSLAYLSLIASYLLDAARDMNRNPKETEMIQTLFVGLEREEKESPGHMEKAVKEFNENFIEKAKERIIEVRTKEEAGLTPHDVFPTLPLPMQACFRKQDKEGLKEVAKMMNPTLFSYHLGRCVKAGLWVEEQPEA